MNDYYYVTRLTADDATSLEPLEDRTRLSFWGEDNYRKFLGELPEYFGCKATGICNHDQGRLIGFLLARALYESLEILKLGVFPEYQRMGVGTQLLETAMTEGLRRGCCRCYLEVRTSNQSAIQFYYNHGFRIAGTRLNYYTNPLDDAWVMEKAM